MHRSLLPGWRCGRATAAPLPAADSAARGRPRPRQPCPGAAANARTSRGHPKIVVLGDSLSAGLRTARDCRPFRRCCRQKLNADGYKWEVVNAGISGDTSAAGLQRVDWALDQGDVRILILELGANDGLRGLPVSEMKKNLAAIIERAQAKARRRPARGHGSAAELRSGIHRIVPAGVSRSRQGIQGHAAAVPARQGRGQAALNQGDGIHPNIEGAAIVADTVWNVLRPMVDAASAS